MKIIFCIIPYFILWVLLYWGFEITRLEFIKIGIPTAIAVILSNMIYCICHQQSTGK